VEPGSQSLIGMFEVRAGLRTGISMKPILPA
jgi:hypothetical protein